MKEQKNEGFYEGQNFEEIKHIDEFGEEYCKGTAEGVGLQRMEKI